MDVRLKDMSVDNDNICLPLSQYFVCHWPGQVVIPFYVMYTTSIKSGGSEGGGRGSEGEGRGGKGKEVGGV
jgi:hypothetical protein